MWQGYPALRRCHTHDQGENQPRHWPGRGSRRKTIHHEGRLKAQQGSRLFFTKGWNSSLYWAHQFIWSTWEHLKKQVALLRLEQRRWFLLFTTHNMHILFGPARRLVAVTAPAPATRRRHNVTVGDPTTGVVSDRISCSCCFCLQILA